MLKQFPAQSQSWPPSRFRADHPDDQYIRGYFHGVVDTVDLALGGFGDIENLLAWERWVRDAVWQTVDGEGDHV